MFVRLKRLCVTTLASLALLAVPGLAHASFPGQNGKLAYSHAGDIWTINPDGNGAVQLTSGTAHDSAPAWSPDGRHIAFQSTRTDPNPASCNPCLLEMDVMNADGTDLHPVVVGQHTYDSPRGPAWSPDGTRIAFVSNFALRTIAANGTDERPLPTTLPPGCEPAGEPIQHFPPLAWSPDGRRLTTNAGFSCGGERVGSCVVKIADGVTSCYDNSAEESFEGWSPDSRRILVGSSGFFRGLFWFEPGGDVKVLTEGEANDGLNDNAAWSPDGTTIVFRRDPYSSDPSPSQVYLIAADGGVPLPLGGPHVGCCYDWQPIPINGYPRPIATEPLNVSLVVAYEPCTSPNRTHGPPLVERSCAPPVRSSGQLTVGTPDSNGEGSKSTARVTVSRLPGDPDTTADEADVRLRTTVTDVRLASDLSDYTGSLETRMELRITDKDNTPHPGGPGAATVSDIKYSFPVPCTATDKDDTIGSQCAVDTTADALVPGTVKERRRTIWQLGQVELYDGAGDAFMRQGIFVP